MRIMDNGAGLTVRLETGRFSSFVSCELEKNNVSIQSATDYQLLYKILFQKSCEEESLTFSKTLWEFDYQGFRGRLLFVLSRSSGERFSELTAAMLNRMFSFQLAISSEAESIKPPVRYSEGRCGVVAASLCVDVNAWLCEQRPFRLSQSGLFDSPKSTNASQTEEEKKLLEELEALKGTTP